MRYSTRCNPMHYRLQPCAPEAATLCTRGCNPTCQRLQPHVPRLQPYAQEAATLCTRGCNRTCAGAMLDALLQENGCLRGGVAAMDAERLAEACVGFGTDDKKLIGTICSRNKQHLGTQIY